MKVRSVLKLKISSTSEILIDRRTCVFIDRFKSFLLLAYLLSRYIFFFILFGILAFQPSHQGYYS